MHNNTKPIFFICCLLHLLLFIESKEKSCKFTTLNGSNKPALRCSGFHSIPNAEERKIQPNARSLLPWEETSAKTSFSSVSLDFRESSTSLLLDLGNFIEKLEDLAIFKAKLPPSLEYLQLGNCSIQAISLEAFKGGDNLTQLNLSHNKLTQLNPQIFKHLQKLKALYLNGNPLKNFEPGTFFPILYNLTKLDLNSCSLTTIEPNLLRNLHNLEELYINKNELSTLNWKILPPLQKLHLIQLYDNPWNCNCQLRLFLEILDNQISKEAVRYLYDVAKCSSSSGVGLSGKVWKEFRSNLINCPPEILTLYRNMSLGFNNAYKAGETILLVCKYFAAPEPSVTWFWNGIVLFNNSKTKTVKIKRLSNSNESQHYIFGEMLIIKNVSSNDRGNYTCSASNQLGKNSSTPFYLDLNQVEKLSSSTESSFIPVTEVIHDQISITTRSTAFQNISRNVEPVGDHSSSSSNAGRGRKLDEDTEVANAESPALRKDDSEEGLQGWIFIVSGSAAFILIVGFFGGLFIWKGRRRDQEEEAMNEAVRARFANASYMREKLKVQPPINEVDSVRDKLSEEKSDS